MRLVPAFVTVVTLMVGGFYVLTFFIPIGGTEQVTKSTQEETVAAADVSATKGSEKPSTQKGDSQKDAMSQQSQTPMYVLADGSKLALEKGAIFILSKNGEKTPLATTTDGVLKFAFGEQENELYVLSERGELLKKSMAGGGYIALTTYGKDMYDDEVIFREWDTGATTTYPYLKGKVLDFWLSPNGTHIAYLVQDGLISCCMSPPTIPSTRLMVMRRDGSEKVVVDQTSHKGTRTFFDGWFFDGSRFVFHDAHPEEGMSGSRFYVGTPRQSDVSLFEGITYDHSLAAHDIVTVAMGEPNFSPNADLIVYRQGGYSGTKIIVARTNGDNARVLLEVTENAITTIAWSAGGKSIHITVDGKETVFESDI